MHETDVIKKVIEDILNYTVGEIYKESSPDIIENPPVRVKQVISDLLRTELLLEINPNDFETLSVSEISQAVKSRLIYKSGKSIFDVYQIVARIAREIYHPKINFAWYADWNDFLNVGNFFTRPDSYSSVEILFWLEQEFNITISDEDAANMKNVGMTIRYIWNVLN